MALPELPVCAFQIWVMAFCVTFVFTVTLSVFPAVTADVKTAFPKWGTQAPAARGVGVAGSTAGSDPLSVCPSVYQSASSLLSAAS